MVAAEGILTARGGMTSHAAVVARGMGKCCVAGCKEIIVDEENKVLKVGGVEYHEGDSISLNGTDGNVFAEAIKRLLHRNCPEISDRSWSGQMKPEHSRSELTLIILEMLSRLLISELRESDFAEQSTCSSKMRESLRSEE